MPGRRVLLDGLPPSFDEWKARHSTPEHAMAPSECSFVRRPTLRPAAYATLPLSERSHPDAARLQTQLVARIREARDDVVVRDDRSQ